MMSLDNKVNETQIFEYLLRFFLVIMHNGQGQFNIANISVHFSNIANDVLRDNIVKRFAKKFELGEGFFVLGKTLV